MLMRRVTLLLGVVLMAAGCGDAGSSAAATTTPLAVDSLPQSVPSDPVSSDSVGQRPTTTLSEEDRVGAKAEGNRVILIGDSVLASTSRRYSNDMCEALVPLGWQVEVDAETGRFADFGLKVLDRRLDAGWDAAVILLGNNYREDPGQYQGQMEEMIQRLGPIPIVLLTVSEFKPSRTEVNDAIRQLEADHDNVMIVDWAATTAADDTLTGGDGLHLTTAGRLALAANVALALGEAPVQPGDCLKTDFRDDSSGPVTGTSVPRQHNVGGGSGGSQSTDTTAAVTVPEDPTVVTDPVVTDPVTVPTSETTATTPATSPASVPATPPPTAPATTPATAPSVSG
ncbi:MAG: SGNH/GDSL hydrolase family protein [Ilumatobacteraceae bacterium]